MIYFNNLSNLLFLYYYSNKNTYLYNMILVTNLHVSIISFFNCWIYPRQFEIYFLDIIVKGKILKIYDILFHQLPTFHMLLSKTPKFTLNAIDSLDFYILYGTILYSFDINFNKLYKINKNLIFISYILSIGIVNIKNKISNNKSDKT